MTPPLNDISEVDLVQAQLLAQQWAIGAGEIALAGLGCSTATRKLDKSVVTNTDHEIQEKIAAEVHAVFPDHSLLGEETVSGYEGRVSPAASRYCWVIDPLDGTRNYVAQLPCFATSIALLDQGVPVIGVVREHNTGQLFCAFAGNGTTLNGTRVKVNTLGENEEHLMGIPSSKDEQALRVARHWHESRGFVCRNLGSTAFEMGLISCGAMTGMLGRRVKIWDIAAGVLLINEAGGKVSDPEGGQVLPFRMDNDPHRNIPMLAATARMHASLLESIRHAMS